MSDAGSDDRMAGTLSFRLLNAWLVAAIIVYPFIGIWQWGDFTDLGYNLMEVQNFFARLDEGRLTSPRLFSYFVGALWWKPFAGLGVLGILAFACTLIVLASFAVVFALKSFSGNSTALLLAALAAQAFYVRNWLQFDYDVVSLVFSVWSAALVVRSIAGGRLEWMFYAGVLATLAAISRTPSVVLLGFVVLPFFNAFLQEKTEAINPAPRIREAAWQGGMLIAGFVAGLLVFVGILWISGLWQAYLEGFVPYVVTKSADGSGGAYDMAVVVQRYIKEAKLLFLFAFLGLSWGVVAAILFRPGASRFMQFSFSLISLAAIVFWVVGGSMQGYGHSLKFLVPGFYFVVALALLVGLMPCDRIVRLAIAAGCLLCIASFAGSNTGLLKMSGGLLFLVPACTVALVNADRASCGQKKVWGWQGTGVLAALALLIGGVSARSTQLYHAASDWLCRYRFVYPVESVPSLAGLRTSQGRAEYLSAVILELNRRIGDKPVYVYGHTPIIYPLLTKDSFIPEIWFANDAYSVDFIVNRLQEKMNETGMRPSVIVTEKTKLGEGSWEKMIQFLAANSYACVYSYGAAGRPCDAELWQVISAPRQ
jgi:hypothetical protein